MYRLYFILFLLGLASPAAAPAQMLGPSTWTLASGDFTIFGHTEYTPTFVLLPRIVYDTSRRLDSLRTVDSVRLASATVTNRFAAGLTAWPTDLYCGGIASGTMQTLDARYLLPQIQLAARCNVRIVIVPPRRRLTTNGLTNGIFSVDSAKRLTDSYAAVLPADTIRKYRAAILGLNLADDYTCADCWGGKPITQMQVASWAAYARTRLPDLPLGVRVTPDWVAASTTLPPLLDYTWAQYTTRRGDAQAFYDKAADIASRLGLKVVMGINVEDCHGTATDACSAAELTRFGAVAVSHPASCAFLSWRYEETTWQTPDIRSAWDGLLMLARAREGRDCRR
jgi:hypothetical protein